MSDTQLATIEPVASGGTWTAMKEQAGVMVRSGFMPPAIKSAEAALAVMLQGREVGFGPMASIRHINIISGKPTLSAEGMLALCYKAIPGFKAEPVEDTLNAFTIRLTRPGHNPYDSRFTMEDAKTAKLLKTDGMFEKYPRAMLRARAISAGCRLVCPDALMGLSYTPEEMGAIVNEEGEVISVESESTPKRQAVKSAMIPKSEAIAMGRPVAPPPVEEVPVDIDWEEPETQPLTIVEEEPKTFHDAVTENAGVDAITEKQLKLANIFARRIFGQTDEGKANYVRHLKDTYQVGATKQLTKKQASHLIDWLKSFMAEEDGSGKSDDN